VGLERRGSAWDIWHETEKSDVTRYCTSQGRTACLSLHETGQGPWREKGVMRGGERSGEEGGTGGELRLKEGKGLASLRRYC